MSKFGFRQMLPVLHVVVYSLLMLQAHWTTPVSQTVSIEYASPIGERLANSLNVPSFVVVAALCVGIGCDPSLAMWSVGLLGIAVWFFVGDSIDRVRSNMLSPFAGSVLIFFALLLVGFGVASWRATPGSLRTATLEIVLSLVVWPIGLAAIGWSGIRRPEGWGRKGVSKSADS